jgi:hypothetical protein
MLSLTGKGSAHTCNGVVRRDFLQIGALGAIGLGLPQLLAAEDAGKIAANKSKRSVIMIF